MQDAEDESISLMLWRTKEPTAERQTEGQMETKRVKEKLAQVTQKRRRTDSITFYITFSNQGLMNE